MCQKFKSSLFLVIFPLLDLSSLQNDHFFQNIWMFGSAFRRVSFYSMIYFIAILVRSLGLKKSMKELCYLPNFWSKVYCDFLDFPKKIWGLGAPPPMGPRTPQMPYFRVLGPIRDWAPRGLQTPNFFLGSPESHNRLCSKK